MCNPPPPSVTFLSAFHHITVIIQRTYKARTVDMFRRFAVAATVLAAMACAAAGQTLPMPQRLMVEYLPSAPAPQLLLVGTTRPRFSFVPHGAWEHPGAGVAMTGYRITVAAAAAETEALAWDSGVVQATSAVAVECGVELPRLRGYRWTAQWWGTSPSAGAPTMSAVASATFDIGPNNASDWAPSNWIGGGGQTEFQLQFPADAAVAKLFVAAPGGAVVYANGQAVSDESGISAWIKNSANLPYVGYNLTGFRAGTATGRQPLTVLVRAGTGFFTNSRWRDHTSGGKGAFAGPVVRLLAVDASGQPVAGTTLRGRAGMVVSSDPFVGGIFDTTLPDDEGWAPAHQITDLPALGLDGPIRAFAVQPAKTGPAAAAALRSSAVSITALPPAPTPRRCTTACDPTSSSSQNRTICTSNPPELGDCDAMTPPRRRWAYGFDRNIIGMACKICVHTSPPT